MSSFALDVRHVARVLRKNLSATVIAVATLALAIGATTAIFSVIYGIMLRPLPYPAPDRLVAIWEVNQRGRYARLADPNFSDFRDRNRTLSAIAKYRASATSVAGAGEPTRATVVTVSKDFFSVVGIQPSLGRTFAGDVARVGALPTVVVSHRYWTQALGSASSLAAFHLRIDGRAYDVIGVMPAGLAFPPDADFWIPAELDPEIPSRTSHNYSAVGRLQDGVSVAQARADLSAIAQDIIRRSPERSEYLMADATVIPLRTSMTRGMGSTLYVLLGAVLFLLLVACANVTNLLLAQAAARQRELAIRHALGAGRARLVRLFIAETLLLLVASCLGGLALARLGLSALLALAPVGLPRLEDVSISRAVLIFAIVVSALIAVALGLLTSLRASRRDPGGMLADGARGQTGAVSARRLGRIVVAAQMAITSVLLIGAVLLGRSLLQVLSVDPGFRTDGIVAMDLALPYSEEPATKPRLSVFYPDLFERLRRIPGVETVAAVNAVPLDGGLPDGLFVELGHDEAPTTLPELRTLFGHKERTGTADYCAASSDYFQVLGIPLVRGRLFDQRDQPSGRHVAVINQSLARSRWPGVDPIGRRIEFGNMDGDLRPLTIVGIVGDTREYGLEQPPRPTLYVNLIQRPRFAATVVMRSSGDVRSIAGDARSVLREVAPDVPPRFRTFAQIYSASLGQRRFNLVLVGVFAGTALVLAVAGIYGVLMHTMTQRRREIGVRLALGARPGQVLRMIVGQAMVAIGTGIAIGVVAAFGVTRTLQSMLFGVTSSDPATFAGVVMVLGAIATLACTVPARRSTHADPVAALREE